MALSTIRALRGVDGIQSDLDGKLGPVLAHDMKVASGAHGARFGALVKGAAEPRMLLAYPLWHQHVDRPADQLLTPVAEQPLGFGIHQHDLAVGVGHDHAAGACFDDKTKSFLGELALGDVGHRAQNHQPFAGADGI
jgi:hypothetical protein